MPELSAAIRGDHQSKSTRARRTIHRRPKRPEYMLRVKQKDVCTVLPSVYSLLSKWH